MLVFITDAQEAACAFEQYAKKINVHRELSLTDGEMWIEQRTGKLLAVFCGVFYDSDKWECAAGEVCFELLNLKLERLEDIYNMGVENPSDINISYFSNDLTMI